MEYVVRLAHSSRKPSHHKLLQLVKPIAFAIEDANGNRDKYSLAYNHTSAVAFTIPAVMWIAQPYGEDTHAFVQEHIKQGIKYIDKIRKKPNLKDNTSLQLHEQWITNMQTLFQQLAQFVQTYYPQGLVWNDNGNVIPEEQKEAQHQPGKISLNKGVWYVENYENADLVELPEDQMGLKQGVLVLNSKSISFKLGVKIKHVTVDNCSNCKIHVNHLLSSLNILNSNRVELFVSGSVPTISVEKTHGCQIWLSKESLDSNPDIVTSNNDQVSLMCPKHGNSQDYVEVPIPQQFVSKVQLNASSGSYKVSTEPVKHF
jgi:hypothetical protein